VLRPIGTEGVAYFEDVLRSPACRRELRIRAKGIVEGFWRLYTDDFYDIRLPVPPAAERRLIAEYCDTATASLEEAKATAEREIALLQDYRTRLTADVVTGKLDVRQAAARLPVEDKESAMLREIEDLGEIDAETPEDAELIEEEVVA
jgi:type I restriction enzyme S subunit